MRILAVGSMYPPHHLGGYELAWRGAMEAARQAGHEVRVLASVHREPGAGPEWDEDVHRELEWHWSWERHAWRNLDAAGRLRLERGNAAVLRRHLAEHRPDVATFWPMGGMSLSAIERCRRAGVPTVLVVHDDWLVYGPEVDAWLRAWRGWRRPLAPIAGAAMRTPTVFRPDRAAAALFNSEHVRGRARSAVQLPERASVVHPGVDGSAFADAGERGWRWRLVCAGRVERQKGTDTAVEALAELPAEARLAIAGSGDDGFAGELRGRAEALGVGERVELRGSVPVADVAALYASSDAVVFPVRWEEPFGLVPLEAMASGTPVVATARGGAAEYLRDGDNALLVPADDPSAVAAAVRRLARDEALRRRLRDGGRRTAATYTAQAFNRQVVEELERAVRRESA